MLNNISDIRLVLTEARRELMAKPNVVATGIGYKIVNGRKTDQLAVICSVATKKGKQKLTAREVIPAMIQNIPTDVLATGTIYALKARTERWRPAPGGVSIGHKDITAGTLGCLVQKNGKRYILSNNHVLANSNAADIGDAILQPGPYDGGQDPHDRIALLSEFVPIEFAGGGSDCPIAKGTAGFLNALAAIIGSKSRLQPVRLAAAGENKVDCAIAEPTDQSFVSSEILEIGNISGVAEGSLGMNVKKSGRTTALTTGSIQQIDVTVQVSYGDKTATFVDQLMAGNMSQGGDSGSVVLDEQNHIVGLLFAGSDTSTIINRIQDVFAALGVTYV